MKVRDYEYNDNAEFEEGITLTDDRKEELIQKVKSQIVRRNIALYQVLKIGENNTEYNFIYEWLNKNGIRLSGINGSISGELENYRHIPKMGQSFTPDILEEQEQERLFNELDNLKKKGVDKDSIEYRDIRNKLIVHNMKLAKWVVANSNLNDLGIEREDLQQMAMEALINVIDKYDISKGYKFSTYAVPTIYYSIKKEWRKSQNNDDQLRTEWQRLDRFEEEMLKSVNREPTDEEIKVFLGISDSRLETLKKYINYHLQESPNNLNKDDEELIIGELLDDESDEELVISELLTDERIEEIIESKPILNGIYIDDGITFEEDTRKVDIAGQISLMKEDLNSVLDTLTEREKQVLELRFGFDGKGARTLEEIGREFKISSQRIGQIEANALKKLRQPHRSKKLRDYLDAELNEYEGIYDEVQDKNQIVDGINIESFDFNMIKKSEDSTKKEIEQLEDENIATIEEQLEELDEISKLLSELNELDKMLKQTSIEIKKEKDKNKELKAKMKKIEDLIQK